MNEFEKARKAKEEFNEINAKRDEAETKLSKLRQKVWDVLGEPPRSNPLTSPASWCKESLSTAPFARLAFVGGVAGLVFAVAYYALPILLFAAIAGAIFWFAKKA